MVICQTAAVDSVNRQERSHVFLRKGLRKAAEAWGRVPNARPSPCPSHPSWTVEVHSQVLPAMSCMPVGEHPRQWAYTLEVPDLVM